MSKRRYILLGTSAVASVIVATEQANAAEEEVQTDALLNIEPQVSPFGEGTSQNLLSYIEPVSEDGSEEVSSINEEPQLKATYDEIPSTTTQVAVPSTMTPTTAIEKTAPLTVKVAKQQPKTIVAAQKTIERSVIAATSPTISEQFKDPYMQEIVVYWLRQYSFTDVTKDSVITETMINTLDYLPVKPAETSTGRITSMEGISIFKNLADIIINETDIEEIPAEISQLQKAVMVTINDNEKLKVIPSDIWSLPASNIVFRNLPSLESLPTIAEGSQVLSTLNNLTTNYTRITDVSFLLEKQFTGLRQVNFMGNHIVHLPNSDQFPLLTNALTTGWIFTNNQIVSIPTIYEEAVRTRVTLTQEMVHPLVSYQFDGYSDNSPQLALKDSSATLTVKNGTLEAMDSLRELVKLDGQRFPHPNLTLELSRAHNLQLADYQDENGQPVALTDYYKDGVVQKAGTIKARIRSMPNEDPVGELSPFAVTGYLTLIFELADEAQPVTVRYVDKEGNNIKDTETHTGQIGEVYNFTYPEITGYIYDSTDGNSQGTFGEVAQTVTFIYEKQAEDASPVTINYLDDKGNTIQPATTHNGKVGDTFNFTPPNINGYLHVKTEGNPQGTFSKEPQTVTFVYKKEAEDASPVTINYLDDKGNTIQPATTHNGIVGEEFNFTQPNIDGYSYVKTEGNPQGTFSKEPQTVTFIYKKNEAVVNPPEVDPPEVEPPVVDPPETGIEDEDGEVGGVGATDKPNKVPTPHKAAILPQTNSVSNNPWTFAGFIMLLGSSLLFWRRQSKN